MDKENRRKNATIPEMIRRFLKEENLTPRQLAATLNVAETTVHRWLKGEAKPTGTAASILWTLIGLGGVALGAGAPGLLGSVTVAARILRGASVGVGALASGVGIYQLLKKRLEKGEDLEKEIEALSEAERQREKIGAMRAKLAEEERKLEELENLTREQGESVSPENVHE
jgi:transcriptional regulator with XRE-family HTH domain